MATEPITDADHVAAKELVDKFFAATRAFAARDAERYVAAWRHFTGLIDELAETKLALKGIAETNEEMWRCAERAKETFKRLEQERDAARAENAKLRVAVNAAHKWLTAPNSAQRSVAVADLTEALSVLQHIEPPEQNDEPPDDRHDRGDAEADDQPEPPEYYDGT